MIRWKGQGVDIVMTAVAGVLGVDERDAGSFHRGVVG